MVSSRRASFGVLALLAGVGLLASCGGSSASTSSVGIERMGVNGNGHFDRPSERSLRDRSERAAGHDSGADDDSHSRVNGQARVTSGARASTMTYHGGPVMTAGVTVYPIWYGNWPATSTTPAVLNGFLGSLNGSPWYGINGGYTDRAGKPVTTKIVLGASSSDPTYAFGKALSDANVGSIVSSAITSGRLPNDPNGQYVVFTSSDVSETSGFLTSYCGWHSAMSVASTVLKFVFVGDPSAKLANCAAQTAISPNGNPAADAMVSILAHEVAEASSDPQLNAWFDGAGRENADKCAWTFGPTIAAANGSVSNLTLAGKSYLVQQNWRNTSTGSCAMS
jgi:hypothetical protein